MTATDETTENTPDKWDEDLDEDYTATVQRRRVSRLSAVLVVVVVGAAGFLAGVVTQKRHDRSLVGATGARTTSTQRSGAAGGGFGGATTGQVKLVDGPTIYVTDSSGNTIAIAVTASSKFTKQAAASLRDIQPGDTVVVRGAAQSDGTIAAATVTDSGAGGAVAGGGRRGGSTSSSSGTAGASGGPAGG